MKTSLINMQDMVQVNSNQGSKNNDHISMLNNKALLVKKNVNKITLEVSDKVNQFEIWIKNMKASDVNMEIPQSITESIQEIITNSSHSLALTEIREEFETFKGEVMIGKHVTKMLRNLVTKLEFQMNSNSSQGRNQSINHKIIHESTNAMREREIVRKGIGRLEKQINQLLATKIPKDKSDIALINKLKVVDVQSLNSAVDIIQKALQKYVKFSGTDYEYCNVISELMDKAHTWG